MNRGFDPRVCNIHFDANAFDRTSGPEDAFVDRVLALGSSREIILVAPWSVRGEALHPHTPADVRAAVTSQIFTRPVGETSIESEAYERVRKVLQGNAQLGKHDADARHLVEASKYGGGYFITHDGRLNRQKRDELQAILPTSLRIVTLEEFIEIYDCHAAQGPHPRPRRLRP